MGYLDRIRDKAAETARLRGEAIGATVDKAATAFNRRTGGKHSEKVSKYAEQAKRKVDEFGRAQPPTRDQDDGFPPEGPPAP